MSSVDKCRVNLLQGGKEYGHALVFSKTFREGGKVVGAWLTCPLQCGVSYQVRLNDPDNLIPSKRGKEDHEDKCMLFKLREVDGMSRMTFKAFLSKVDRGEIKTYTGIEAEKGEIKWDLKNSREGFFVISHDKKSFLNIIRSKDNKPPSTPK